MINSIRNWRIFTFTSVLTINILALLFLTFSHWPEWWRNINFEDSHLTWFSSVQLIMIGFASISCFFWSTILGTYNSFVDKYLFGAMGCGFIFLSLDEKFMIHERLREKVFIPNEIGTEITGVGAGDFLHLVIAAVGLVVSYFIIKQIKASKLSLTFYCCAVGLALYSVITDATMPIPPADAILTEAEITTGRLHQFTEEILETFAQAFFLMSFINLSFERLELFAIKYTNKVEEDL
jgi:hypothetical protein